MVTPLVSRTWVAGKTPNRKKRERELGEENVVDRCRAVGLTESEVKTSRRNCKKERGKRDVKESGRRVHEKINVEKRRVAQKSAERRGRVRECWGIWISALV